MTEYSIADLIEIPHPPVDGKVGFKANTIRTGKKP
jgi:hypothetical protein